MGQSARRQKEKIEQEWDKVQEDKEHGGKMDKVSMRRKGKKEQEWDKVQEDKEQGGKMGQSKHETKR